jgi:hypothetical protein
MHIWAGNEERRKPNGLNNTGWKRMPINHFNKTEDSNAAAKLAEKIATKILLVLEGG